MAKEQGPNRNLLTQSKSKVMRLEVEITKQHPGIMSLILNRALLLLTAWVALFSICTSPANAASSANAPAPRLTLTGASVFNANTTGDATIGQVWNTDPNNPANFLTTSPSLRNSAPQPDIHFDLTPGTHTFYITGINQLDNFYGLNLYFNKGSAQPNISVYAPRWDGLAATSPFHPNHSQSTPKLAYNSAFIPASNRTTFADNGTRVTLTDFKWTGDKGQFTLKVDRVMNPAAALGSGALLSAGAMTVATGMDKPGSINGQFGQNNGHPIEFPTPTPAPVPEPETWAMIGLGCIAVLIYGYRQRRLANRPIPPVH